jgi:hypothetical protein
MTLDEALNPNQNILVVLQFTGEMMVLIRLFRPKTIFISGKGKHWHSGFSALTDEAGINPSLPILKNFLIMENFL